MQQLQLLLGENGAKFAIWSIIGLGALIAILLLILVIRRLFSSSFNMNGSGDRRNRPPRLGVTDFFNLDRQGRRLVIVRRDNVEHLVLIGGPNDILIEQNIIRGLRPELPIVEPSARPTVSSKTNDEANSDIVFRKEPINQPSKNIVPETQSPAIQKTPKLNTQNLDLRASVPVAAPVQNMTPIALEPARIVTPAPVEKEQVTKPIPMPEIVTQKPIEPKTPTPAVADVKVQKVPAPNEAPAPNHEPVKKPISTVFGDAAKRLEEALRRPIDASPPKPSELKTEAPKITAPSGPEKTETPKPVEPRKTEPTPIAQTQQSTPASPIAKTEPLASDTLVLDLEQEMARLLGRTPGKGQ